MSPSQPTHSAYPTDAGENLTPHTAGERRGVLRQILLCLLLLEIAILLFILRREGTFTSLFTRWIAAHTSIGQALPLSDYKAVMKNDPALGFLLPNTPIGNCIRKLHVVKRPYLLVFVGDCASCLSINLADWQHAAIRYSTPLLVLTTASPKEAKAFLKQQGVHLPIVSDPKGQLVQALNAVWRRRAYLFSSQNRLLWLGKDAPFPTNPFTQPAFLHVLEEPHR
ncbi:MAG TPA: hypothetical protein VKV18_09780 [Chthonomonas sp.]|nr:hypothetical protein [Chthonomonas sp.]